MRLDKKQKDLLHIFSSISTSWIHSLKVVSQHGNMSHLLVSMYKALQGHIQLDMHTASCWSLGQIVDGPSNGPAPAPWSIPVQPTKMFHDHHRDIEVPHTAFVKKCHDCSGSGKNRCKKCSGSGKVLQNSCHNRQILLCVLGSVLNHLQKIICHNLTQ